MLAHPEFSKYITVEEYLDWEAHQEGRHEYVDGEIIAMTGGSIPHNDLALNLYRSLYPHLKKKGCRVNVSDVKVQVTPTIYYYPDLVVSCDPRDLNSRQFIEYPKLIVEVLSPSTEGIDRGKKFKNYQKKATLQEYVLIDSEKISVECYRRGEGCLWTYTPHIGQDRLTLESIEFSLDLATLYEDVAVEDEDEDDN